MTEAAQAAETARYEGKPLLRLLELYVLWSIGELTGEDEARLEALTPELRDTYGADGSWHEIVARVVELDERLPRALETLWRRRLEGAREAGEALTADAFAREVVDQNFV